MTLYKTKTRIILVLSVIFVIMPGIIPLHSEETGMIPEAVVSMPGPGSSVVIVEKSTQTFYIYRYENELNEVMRFPCSTGKLSGRKKEAGDMKTPEGVYFITGKYVEKDLSPVYGVLAYPVDYPNLLDTAAGRTGYAIWLHGTDRELKPRDSNGCVALENENLKKAEPFILINHTPIIIVEKISHIRPEINNTVKNNVSGLLNRFAQAMENGSYHQYLAGYAPDFAPDISWWNRWRKVRSGAGGEISVLFKNIGIYRDGPYYAVLFDECLRYDDRLWKVGVRKLYLAPTEGGTSLLVRGENYKYIRYVDRRPPKGVSPLIAVAGSISEAVEARRVREIKKRIVERVMDWAGHWEKGDIAAYSKYYSENFSSSGMDKDAWIDRKNHLKNLYDYIRVEIADLEVRLEKDRASVSFDQDYRSSGYSARGNKTLVMINEDKEWKIIQEIWKKS